MEGSYYYGNNQNHSLHTMWCWNMRTHKYTRAHIYQMVVSLFWIDWIVRGCGNMESISSFFKEKNIRGRDLIQPSSLFRTRYLHVNEVSLKIWNVMSTMHWQWHDRPARLGTPQNRVATKILARNRGLVLQSSIGKVVVGPK